MKDILDRNDVELLVDKFYNEAITDPEISHYFNDLIAHQFETHKTRICDFWDDLIFHGNLYKGNPMLVHINLHAKKNLTPVAFNTWLRLWEKTVTENFIGDNAATAISRAKQIGVLMQLKIKKSTT